MKTVWELRQISCFLFDRQKQMASILLSLSDYLGPIISALQRCRYLPRASSFCLREESTHQIWGVKQCVAFAWWCTGSHFLWDPAFCSCHISFVYEIVEQHYSSQLSWLTEQKLNQSLGAIDSTLGTSSTFWQLLASLVLYLPPRDFPRTLLFKRNIYKNYPLCKSNIAECFPYNS